MPIALLSHVEINFVFFLVLYLKTTSLNSLKIMKKSPITEYSDVSQDHLYSDSWYQIIR